MSLDVIGCYWMSLHVNGCHRMSLDVTGSHCKSLTVILHFKFLINPFLSLTLYKTLSLHIYGGGKIYSDTDIEKAGRSDHFPEGTGCLS